MLNNPEIRAMKEKEGILSIPIIEYPRRYPCVCVKGDVLKAPVKTGMK